MLKLNFKQYIKISLGKSNRRVSFNKQALLIYKISNFLILRLFQDLFDFLGILFHQSRGMHGNGQAREVQMDNDKRILAVVRTYRSMYRRARYRKCWRTSQKRKRRRLSQRDRRRKYYAAAVGDVVDIRSTQANSEARDSRVTRRRCSGINR